MILYVSSDVAEDDQEVNINNQRGPIDNNEVSIITQVSSVIESIVIVAEWFLFLTFIITIINPDPVLDATKVEDGDRYYVDNSVNHSH